MKYRTFGKLGWQGSALGFGCGRLRLRGQEPRDVDEAEAVRMIRYAIDHGVNYVDTAYAYNDGNSERVLGKALQDGYRDRVKLADKLPWWMAETAADCDRLLNEQLERLQDDHIDVYLLHAMSRHPDSWPKVRHFARLGRGGDRRRAHWLPGLFLPRQL
jgi:predicted aldo/keto reductase-like oxidoreductase